MSISRDLDRKLRKAAERVLVEDERGWVSSREIMKKIGRRVNSDGGPLGGKYMGRVVRHVNPKATQGYRTENGRGFRVWEGVALKPVCCRGYCTGHKNCKEMSDE